MLSNKTCYHVPNDRFFKFPKVSKFPNSPLYFYTIWYYLYLYIFIHIYIYRERELSYIDMCLSLSNPIMANYPIISPLRAAKTVWFFWCSKACIGWEHLPEMVQSVTWFVWYRDFFGWCLWIMQTGSPVSLV